MFAGVFLAVKLGKFARAVHFHTVYYSDRLDLFSPKCKKVFPDELNTDFAGWHSEELSHYELQFVIKRINTFAAYKTMIYMTHHSSQAQFRKDLLCIEHLNVSYLKCILFGLLFRGRFGSQPETKRNNKICEFQKEFDKFNFEYKYQ